MRRGKRWGEVGTGGDSDRDLESPVRQWTGLKTLVVAMKWTPEFGPEVKLDFAVDRWV